MINKHSLLVFLFMFFVHLLGFGQDTLKTLTEVNVTSFERLKSKRLEISSQTISREQILLSQPEDVGAILQKFSGVSLKSYGGLGGLKTISVKGLGSNHTTFLVDGFTVSNTQTGQVNLGQVQTDNVESISLSSGGINSFLLPVSSYMNGSVVSINTFENNFSPQLFNLRFASRLGSFGEIDTYVSTKFSNKNVFFSAFGKYRQANGNYAYSLRNGKMLYEGIRKNNDLLDWYSGISSGFKFKNNSQLRLIYKTNGADQGLPGAVILYNTMANQRLSTEAHSVNIDFTHQYKSFSSRIFGIFNHDWLHYTDAYFLNNTGGISSRYTNNSAQIGASTQRLIGEQSILFGGIESRYSDLSFSTLNSAVPKRLHSFGLIGFNLNKTNWITEAQVSAQQVIEENKTGERAENRFKVNPFLAIEKKEVGTWKWKFKVWYRNSFRMPTFNELYYNSIGNVKLKPEEANQFSIGFSNQPIQKKMDVFFTLNGFANRVENQILAIPTKNLFVWSMQNIGRVTTLGFETRIDVKKQIKKNWSTELNANYTYQYSVDVSSNKSPTYLNQVAYIPRHTSIIEYSLKRKDVGLQVSSTLSSLRYSLNENIVSNQVKGFALFDASIFSKINFQNKHQFRIQFSVKNIFNLPYAYIRYFVMPGRNYLITLNYALR